MIKSLLGRDSELPGRPAQFGRFTPLDLGVPPGGVSSDVGKVNDQ